jgi:hypothetical protein
MFASDGERLCGRCGVRRPMEEFAWRRKSAKTRHPYCRSCMAEYNRAHYRANRQLYIDRARRRGIAVRRERIAYLMEYFRANPCVDCGEADPLVLEFDHLSDKAFNISEGLRDRSWRSILDEIAKCEVVCANCHRRRTAHRAGFARLAAVGQMEDAAAVAAGDRGIEPRAAVLETAMLPLHQSPGGTQLSLATRAMPPRDGCGREDSNLHGPEPTRT